MLAPVDGRIGLLGPRSARIDQARSDTEVAKRTEVKDKVRALREQLPVGDQPLLILHIDRGLAWRELAVVMHDDGEAMDHEAFTRESAGLRQRFSGCARPCASSRSPRASNRETAGSQAG